MPHPTYLPRTIYVAASPGDLHALLARLGIAPGDVLPEETPPYDYLAEHRNAAIVQEAQGDVSHVVELHLWGMTVDDLADHFRAASRGPVSIVDEPTGADPSPFDGTLFHDGASVECEVVEDEVLGEVVLHAPKALRKAVVANAGRRPNQQT